MDESVLIYVTGPDTGLREATWALVEAQQVTFADMLERMPLRILPGGKKKAGPTLRALVLHTTKDHLEAVMERLSTVSTESIPVRAVALPVLAALRRGEWS